MSETTHAEGADGETDLLERRVDAVTPAFTELAAPPADTLESKPRAPSTKALRRALGMTQQEFADRFQISVGTLRDWEQGRGGPDRTARAYLRAIAGDPEAVRRALESAAPRLG